MATNPESLARSYKPLTILAERRNPIIHPGGGHLYVTDEEDLANAYLGALEAVQIGHGRFDAVFIAAAGSPAALAFTPPGCAASAR